MEPPKHPFAERATGAQAHLRILSTSDLHMQLLPHDYVADRPVAGRGLALAAAEAERARAEAAQTVLFDTGDAFQGGPLDCPLARAEDGAHPMAQALATAGVAAAVPGNHDFNHGLPALKRTLGACAFPVVLANIVQALGRSAHGDVPFLRPYALIDRDLVCGDGLTRRLRLGVIGLAPPQTLDWDFDKLAGRLLARDIVESAAAWVPRMRADGAEIVVALCHSGIGAARPPPESEHAAVPVAELPGVDVVLAGHAHRRFPDRDFVVAPGAAWAVDTAAGRLHGKPAVMPGFWGRDLGQIDLLVQPRPEGGWEIAESESALRPVRAVTPHRAVADGLQDYHAAALARTHRVVGRTRRRLHTYFALIHDCEPVRLVHAAQLAFGRRMLADTPAADLPLLSAAAPLKAGGLSGPDQYTDVPAGEVQMRHLVDLYAYPNTPQIATIRGAQLRHWLERAASVFRRIVPGAGATALVDPQHPSYNFDMIAGVTCRIDLTRPAAFAPDGRPLGGFRGRVRCLRVGGAPVRAEDRFALVTSSYRLWGQIGFPAVSASEVLATGEGTTREVLAQFIAAGGATAPLPQPSWSFLPVPGAVALFDTGPGARDAALPYPARMLRRLGAGAGGFDRWALDLSRLDAAAPEDAAARPGHERLPATLPR